MAQLVGNISHKKIDPSTLPPAVRRAAEEADRLQREATNTPEPAPETPATEEPTPESPPEPAPVTPEVKPEGSPAAQEAQEIDWEARFRAENGRVRKLTHDVSGLQGQINELHQLLATVQTPPAASGPQEASSIDSVITPEEEQEWGEVLPVIKKAAKQIVAPLEAKLRERIDELDQQLKGVGQQQSQFTRDRLFQYLDREVSDWREINHEPAFVDEWLKETDPLSGQVRHQMLSMAFERNDAPRVAEFFRSFLRETAPAAPQRTQSGKAPAPQAPPKPSLETFAAPGRANSGAPPSAGAADKEIISRTDIARFFADKVAGRFKGREKEADEYERQINLAVRENRIR